MHWNCQTRSEDYGVGEFVKINGEETVQENPTTQFAGFGTDAISQWRLDLSAR
jgi:hypothetical protein